MPHFLPYEMLTETFVDSRLKKKHNNIFTDRYPFHLRLAAQHVATVKIFERTKRKRCRRTGNVVKVRINYQFITSAFQASIPYSGRVDIRAYWLQSISKIFLLRGRNAKKPDKAHIRTSEIRKGIN